MAENEEKKETKEINEKLIYGIVWIVSFIALVVATSFLLVDGSVVNLILGISMFFVGITLVSYSIPLFGKSKLLGASLYSISLGSVLIGAGLLAKASWIGAVLMIIFLPLILFLFIYQILAPKNVFFTFIEEGTAKMVMRGGRFQKGKLQGGKFHKALTQWRGYVLEKKDPDKEWEVVSGEEKHLFGGLRWFGFWPLDRIYKYEFEWTGLKPDGTPKYHPPELLDYIMVKEDVYFIEIKQAEDKELLPLDVGVVLPIKVVNPYKALFKIQNWLEAVTSLINPAVRNMITSDTYKNLIKKQEDISKKLYEKLESALQELKKDYGVEVRRTEIYKIDPPELLRAETLKQFSANREKERIITLAKAERQKVLVLADAEKQRIDTVYRKVDELGETGRFVRAAEMAEKSPEQGSKWILGLSGIAEFLSKPFQKLLSSGD